MSDTCRCGQWHISEYGPVCPSEGCGGTSDSLYGSVLDTELLDISGEWATVQLVSPKPGQYAGPFDRLLSELLESGDPGLVHSIAVALAARA